MDPSKDTKKTSRSSSLTRGGLGATSLSQPKPKPSRKTDPLSQSLRVEPTKSRFSYQNLNSKIWFILYMNHTGGERYKV